MSPNENPLLQQQQFLQQIATGLISNLPRDWRAAKLVVSVEPDSATLGFKLALTNPELTDQTGDINPDVAQPIIDLFMCMARIESRWIGMKLQVRRDEGDWQITNEFMYDDSGETVWPADLGQAEIQFSVSAPSFDPARLSEGFKRLAHRHLPIGIEKQTAFAEKVDGSAFEMHVQDNRLSFANGTECEVQLIGSASTNGTWLWSWANEDSQLPPGCLTLASQIRQIGERDRIEEFTTPLIPLSQIDPMLLGFVVCGVADADMLFWANYEHGSSLLVGSCEAARSGWSNEPQRIATLIMQSLNYGEFLDHRLLAKELLEQKGYEIEESADRIDANSSALKVGIDFDDIGRIVNLQLSN